MNKFTSKKTDLTTIKHIIFDLGGVILNIDYKRTEMAFIELGITDFHERYSQLAQTPIFDHLETGKISSQEFISLLREMSNNIYSDEQVIHAWNAMLLEFPIKRLQILQQLQLDYNLFLLSNTNAIHEQAFNQILKSLTGFDSMAVFFNKVYYSHHIGLRKPDKEAFEFILKEHNLQAKHTLFIDDSPQHIETAKNIGIQTIYLKRGMTIEDDVFK